MLQASKTLQFVIPIFNEEVCVPEMIARLQSLKLKMSDRVSVTYLFIDDGSTDRTLNILHEAANSDGALKVISLSRNFGHQIALTAGLDHSDADYVAIIDGDLQDPPELVEPMLEVAKQGYDVVYGKRVVRAGETWLKLATAKIFYKTIRALCRVNIPENAGDFRLITRRVLLAIREMRETNRFIRGMIPWIGFKSCAFDYKRDARFAGETKYPFTAMMRFALDAILSFSNKPLRLATYLGLGFIGLAGLLAFYIIYLRLFSNRVVPGLTVLIVTVIAMGGFQVLMLGLIGEYIGRIFEESKNRPLYFIGSKFNV